MARHLNLIAYGGNLAADRPGDRESHQLLVELEARLHEENLSWADVSLLACFSTRWFDNSEPAERAATDTRQRAANDDFVETLTSFCQEREWFPSLVGCSALSGYYSGVGSDDDHSDISNGYLLVAVCSKLVDRVPVGVHTTDSLAERDHVAVTAVERAAEVLARDFASRLDGITPDWVYRTSTALLFSTGSGHISQRQEVSFEECFATGQELLKLHRSTSAHIVGGHSSNGPEQANQAQVLFHSVPQRGGAIRYKWSDEFGAVAAFLPHMRLDVTTTHPYKAPDGREHERVTLHPKGEYSEGRRFYVSRINGNSVESFFAENWGKPEAEVREMAKDRKSIPSAPELHKITLASAESGYSKDTAWPNVPVWFEYENGEGSDILLRLVRAEYADATMFLMKLETSALAEATEEFMDKLRLANPGSAAMSFLCESRKYVLMDEGSNAEAAAAIRKNPAQSVTFGVYLNGEYSVGDARSIGYHNYSQISAIARPESLSIVPPALHPQQT